MKKAKFDPDEMRRWRLTQPPISCEEDFMGHLIAGQKLRDERLAQKQKTGTSKDDAQKK